MFTASFLSRRFCGRIRFASLEKAVAKLPPRIEFITPPPRQRYAADRIYLCAGWPAHLDEAEFEDGSLLVICRDDAQSADTSAHTSRAVKERAFATIELDCTCAEAFNILSAAIEETEEWERRFFSQLKRRDFQAIVSLGSDLGRCPVLMTDEEGFILASARLDASVLLSEKDRENGAAVSAYAKGAIDRLATEDHACLDEEEHGTLFCQRVRHADGSTSYLMVEDADGLKDRETLCRLIAEEVQEHSAHESMEAIKADMKAFCRCFEAIEERALSNTVEIRNAFDSLPHPVDNFVSLAVVVFPEQKGRPPYRDLLLKLHTLFPHENITIYNRDIVILLSQPVRSFRPNFESVDTERLSKLLIGSNAMMAVSSKIKQQLNGIPTLYALTRQAALLAYALRDMPSRSRIVFYEDYSIYCFIDLCMKQYLKSGMGTDPVFMIHSSIIQLTRYDMKHNSNLRDVLYHYLSCDRNLVKTAAATYMHRNTIVNKINKITGLLQLDLNDERLRQKLIFSCQIVLYVERVMNRSLAIPEE